MRRQKSDAYLDWIRGLPCVACGNPVCTEAAHIRYSDILAGKRQTGIGEKPDDTWTVPLCSECHREQHKTSERAFWSLRGIDPVRVALALYRVNGDRTTAQKILEAWRPNDPI